MPYVRAGLTRHTEVAKVGDLDVAAGGPFETQLVWCVREGAGDFGFTEQVESVPIGGGLEITVIIGLVERAGRELAGRSEDAVVFVCHRTEGACGNRLS